MWRRVSRRPAGSHDPGSRGQSLVEFALLAPLMAFLLFMILDFSRIYTTMMSVESAAREAADYSTTFGAGHWSTADLPSTVAEMQRRACVASSNLPDYAGIESDPSRPGDESCSNPTFAYCVTPAMGSPCGPVSAADLCDDPQRDPPCEVTVTLHHEFHLFVPFHVDFFGVQLGLPVSIGFDRDSTFAMTDIGVAPSPTP